MVKEDPKDAVVKAARELVSGSMGGWNSLSGLRNALADLPPEKEAVRFERLDADWCRDGVDAIPHDVHILKSESGIEISVNDRSGRRRSIHYARLCKAASPMAVELAEAVINVTKEYVILPPHLGRANDLARQFLAAVRGEAVEPRPTTSPGTWGL